MTTSLTGYAHPPCTHHSVALQHPWQRSCLDRCCSAKCWKRIIEYWFGYVRVQERIPNPLSIVHVTPLVLASQLLCPLFPPLLLLPSLVPLAMLLELGLQCSLSASPSPSCLPRELSPASPLGRSLCLCARGDMGACVWVVGCTVSAPQLPPTDAPCLSQLLRPHHGYLC